MTGVKFMKNNIERVKSRPERRSKRQFYDVFIAKEFKGFFTDCFQ